MNPSVLSSIVIGMNALTNDSIPILVEDAFFDIEGFKSRINEYKLYLGDNKYCIHEVCQKMEIDFSIFHIETTVMTAIMPVCMKFLDANINRSLFKQKQFEILLGLQKKHKVLTTELVCEKLYMDVASAKSLAEEANVRLIEKKSYQNYTRKDFLSDTELQSKYLKWMMKNPYADLDEVHKSVGLPIRKYVLKHGLNELAATGQIVPCVLGTSPMELERIKKDIMSYKMDNPYAPPTELAREFGVSVEVVQQTIEEVTEQWRREKKRSHEIYFKKTLDRLDDVEEKCLHRFEASDSSSSRWPELVLMGIEKKVRMLGLNAPAELNVNQDIRVQSKEERDAIVTAYYATDQIEKALKDDKENGLSADGSEFDLDPELIG